MKKTTVYLPDELKRGLERVAAQSRRSEAELIREGIVSVIEAQVPPRPRIPLFNSGQSTAAARVDELRAEGFGRD
jgi:Arc/MetJ-type ribon-helix-helix transcriptional regulator